MTRPSPPAEPFALVPVGRLWAWRSTSVTTNDPIPVIESQPIACLDRDEYKYVADYASRLGDGIYEWGSCRDGYSPQYVQVRDGAADWRRTDVALRKIVERDCGRWPRLEVTEPWLRRTALRRHIFTELVRKLLPTDATYGVRLFGSVVGAASGFDAPEAFFGLQLDDDVGKDVGRQLGTIVVDGMLAVRSEAVGRYQRVECLDLRSEAPCRAERWTLVEMPEGPFTERVVATASSFDELCVMEKELEERRTDDAVGRVEEINEVDEACLRSIVL